MRIGPARVVGAQHGVATCHCAFHGLGVHHIGLHHFQVPLCGDFFGLARKRHHFVAALQQLVQYGSADKSGSANQCDLHGEFLGQNEGKASGAPVVCVGLYCRLRPLI
ncbi:hypothetical protein D3C72_1641970 [compost metagenome]